MDQGSPLELWIRYVFGNKRSKGHVNVPRKFCQMPCGCTRQPSEGRNFDATETWHLRRIGEDIVHTECGRVVLSLRAVPQRPLWGPELEDIPPPELMRPSFIHYTRTR